MKKIFTIKPVLFYFISILLLFCTIFNINCTSTRKIIQIDKYNDLTENKIFWISLKDGSDIVFNWEGGKYINKPNDGQLSDSTSGFEFIAGKTPGNRYVEIPLKNISEAQIEEKHFEVSIVIAILAFPIFLIELIIIAIGLSHVGQ
jgi:hypothetical protein